MRILHVNKFAYRRGGADAYMLDLVELQRAEGHEVEIFSMAHPRNEPCRFSDRFPPNVELEPPPGGVGAKVKAGLGMLWSFRAARALGEVTAIFEPDVAHLHNVYHQLSPSVIRSLRQQGVPAVMTLHDFKLVCPSHAMFDHGRPCEACLPHSFHQAALHRCKDDSMLASGLLGIELGLHRALGAYDDIDRLICPSEFMATMMRRGGIAADRLRRLPNFTSIPDVAAPDNPEGCFLYVGRLLEPKAVDVIIDAVATVPGAALQVVGEGPDRAALERHAAATAPGQVRFLGHLDRDGVAEVMRGARAVVLASRSYENQPLVLLEAMALGLPVIGTDLGGTPELIDHGRSGLLFGVDDAPALAAAMALLLQDRSLARDVGAEARRQVTAAHAPDRHLRDLADIYAEAAGARRLDGRSRRLLGRSGGAHGP